MQLKLGSVHLIDDDEDIEEFEEEEEKVPICKRCWIFKRNKDFVQGQVSSALRPPENAHVGVDRYAEHKKFISRLKEFQQSQPYEKTIKAASVTQLVSDSVEEIKNLFVNNKIVHNSKVNLKALASSIEKKKELGSPLAQNSIFGGGRSLRLSRKCKQKNQQIFDFEDDDDLLFEGGGTDTHIQYTGKTKRDKVKHPVVNGENNGRASQSVIPKVVLEEDVVPPSPEKIFELPEASSTVSSKKRKMDVKTKDDDDFISVSTSKNSKAHQTTPTKSDNNARVSNKRRINGEDEAKEPPNNVIEIDGEVTGEEEVSTKAADANVTPKINCPMCNKLFPVDAINDHAYTCQGPQTQTRSQQSNTNGSRGTTYNATAWNNACRGLNPPDNSETSGKINGPAENPEHCGTSENKFENKGREKSKQIKDPLKEVRLPSKLENKKIFPENQKNRMFAAKTSGYQNLNLNKSTQELLEGYAKTLHKVRNPSKAKQMRSFGEDHSEEQEHVTKCARCDQFVADDQLNNHTDQCFEKSVLIE